MTQPSVVPPTPSLPSENVGRGVIFALIVVPLGILAWDVLWSVGFVASIVAFGIAWGAVRLYRFGSGGRVTRNGAIAVTVVTIGTLALAFVSGFVIDVVQVLVGQGATVSQALSYPPFGGYVIAAMTQPQSLVSLLLAVVFGALGSFSILRRAFAQSRAPQAVPPGYVQPGYAPQPGYQQPGYQQPGYQQQPGYPQPYAQPTYQQPTYQQPTYPAPPAGDGIPAIPAPPADAPPTAEQPPAEPKNWNV